MAVDFTQYSNYAPTAAFSSIIFGAGSDVLEVEMNELQLIQNEKFRRMIKQVVGDGVLSTDAITYSTGNVRINDTYAFVDGYMIKITPTGLAYPITDGSVKLAVWEEEARGANDGTPAVLKLEGNVQETSTITNMITDVRAGGDVTTRRKLIKYTLVPSTDNVAGRSYLTIATVAASVITSKAAPAMTNTYVTSAVSTLTSNLAATTATANAAIPTGTNGLGGYAKSIGAAENLNSFTQSGFYTFNTSTVSQPTGFGGGLMMVTGASATSVMQMIFSLDGAKVMMRNYTGSSWTAWRNVWTSGFMGASSGLDADLLDGQQGSYYTNASNLSSGTAPAARLGTGTPSSSTYLRGDGAWTVPPIPASLTSGSTSAGFVAYNGTAATAGQFDGGTTAPTGTNRLNYGGYLYATRVYNAVYNDYAEYFEKNEDSGLEPGDVVALDPETGKYRKAQGPYDRFVVGVFSDDYANCIGGKGDGFDDENFASVGLAGRVRVKVFGRVTKGDLLVSSNVDGVAMPGFQPGCVVAKALEDHDGPEIDRIKALILNT